MVQKSAKCAGLCLLVLLAGTVAFSAQTTRLHNIRFGVHDGFLRLVFDAEGARPARLDHSVKGELTLHFDRLETALPPSIPCDKAQDLMDRVEIRRRGKDAVVVVLYGKRDVSLEHHYMEGSPPAGGAFRLVVDFRMPKAGNVEGNRLENREEVIPGMWVPDDVQPLTPAASGGIQTVGDAPIGVGRAALPAEAPAGDHLSCLDAGRKLLEAGSHQAAMETFRDCAAKPHKAEASRLEALYGFADALYLHHEPHLMESGPDVLTAYSEALKAGPLEGRTPLSIFRCAHTCMVMGDWRRAEGYLLQLVKEHPKDALVGQAWLRLARIYLSAASFLESIQAGRKALEHPLSPSEQAEARKCMGEGYHMLGEAKGAVENFERCLVLQPGCYLSQPEMLRQLGESQFSMGNHERSNEHLLHYLNLLDGIPDRDFLMARIAENLALMGQNRLALKMRNYVSNQYPGTEGAAIVALRTAEICETEEPTRPEQALAIYQDLLAQPLDSELKGLVKLKTALWHWKYGRPEESLEIIEEALVAGGIDRTAGDFALLKDQVLLSLIKKAFSQNDHRRVVALYVDNIPTIKRENSPQLLRMVAESHGAMKLYPEAMALYHEILNSGQDTQECLLKLGKYSLLMGDIQRAAGYVSKTGSLKSNEKSELLGRMAVFQGNHVKAVEHFSSIQKDGASLVEKDLDWLAVYVESLQKVGRTTEALKWADAGLKVQGDAQTDLKVTLALLKVATLREFKKIEEAAETLETVLAWDMGEDVKSRLIYQLSSLYNQAGMEVRAVERLTQLSQSPDPFWQSVAKQQLDYLHLKREGLLNF